MIFISDFGRRSEVSIEDNFECLEKLSMLHFFRFFGLSGFYCNIEKQQFLSTIVLFRCFVQNWVHRGGNPTFSCWKTQVWKMDKMKKVNVSGNYELSKRKIKEHKWTILPSIKNLYDSNVFVDEVDEKDEASGFLVVWVWKESFLWRFRPITILI